MDVFASCLPFFLLTSSPELCPCLTVFEVGVARGLYLSRRWMVGGKGKERMDGMGQDGTCMYPYMRMSRLYELASVSWT